MRLKVSIQREPEASDLPLPAYATAGASGMDLCAAVPGDLVLGPGERACVSTGLRVAVPEGFEAQIRPRSGLALRHGLSMVNTPGTVDSDYRGVVHVLLINHGSEPVTIHRGERIAQMVLCAAIRVDWDESDDLGPTARGDGGFGHTGR